MAVSVLLKLLPAALAEGRLAGQLELVGTGEQVVVQSAEELVAHLRAGVLRGGAGHPPPPANGGRLAEQLQCRGLTGRESQVLAIVAQGRSTKQAGAELTLSPRTVDVHVAHALEKLGVRTRIEALARLGHGTGG